MTRETPSLKDRDTKCVFFVYTEESLTQLVHGEGVDLVCLSVCHIAQRPGYETSLGNGGFSLKQPQW